MHILRPLWLLLVAGAGAVLAVLATLLSQRLGGATPVLPLSSLASMGIIVLFTVVLGLSVRRWRNGKRDRELNPILAARTAILAQACAYAGALLAGWHVGIGAMILTDLLAGALTGTGWRTLALIAGGIVMLVVGIVVERFCRIPPEDGPPSEPHDELRQRKSSGEGEYA
ncbi:MAG: DUF3180 domain-containing protein [Acidobacteria bacterium]|nr:DUF3180 domain-containing protein [Acidobacteriota bacterium]